MIGCSITRREHNKSQYLQTVQLIMAMLDGCLPPQCQEHSQIMVRVLPLHTVLVVDNKSVSMKTLHGVAGPFHQ